MIIIMTQAKLTHAIIPRMFYISRFLGFVKKFKKNIENKSHRIH